MIKCEETATVSEETIAELVRVWESSVRATHLFLSESEIDRIKGYVPQALRQVRHLIVATEDGVPVAFAGVDAQVKQGLLRDTDALLLAVLEVF